MTIAETKRESRFARSLIGLAVLLFVVTVLYANRSTDIADIAIRNEAQFKEWAVQSCLTACLTVVLVYALTTSLPVPVASIGSLFVGWLFGFWIGVPVVSIGSTLGASITFLITRYYFHDSIRAISSKQLESLQKGFLRDGIYYIAALRLLPGLPFFLVNAFLAQTRVSFWTFWTTSMISMLPATAIYVSAGATFPSLARIRDDGLRSVMSWQLGLAFAALAVQPVVFRVLVARYRREKKANV